MRKKSKIIFNPKNLNHINYKYWLLIYKSKCPFCNVSLRFTELSTDKLNYICKKCKNTMPCGGGGIGVPDVVSVANNYLKS